MKFLSTQYFVRNIDTKLFFGIVNNIIEGKIYLHDSHIKGGKYGYAHSFYYLKVRQNK